MKKKLLTSADLLSEPPSSIDLDTYILAPSARVTAERLGIPFHKGGQPLDSAFPGSSKMGGPGAGEYRLVRPEFTPSAHVPRFGNPTHATLEPLHGSKAWRKLHGDDIDQVRALVTQRLGAGANPVDVERGVQQVLAQLPALAPSGNPSFAPASVNPLNPGGASLYASPLPGGVPSTTPLVHGGQGSVTYKGNGGEIHIILAPTPCTYVVQVRNGHAKITEVPE